MNPKHTVPSPASPGITPTDVYYILFRHKWLIAILSVVAVAAAISVRLLWHVPYMSGAELLIKYIKEAKPLQEGGTESELTRPVFSDQNVVNTEISILTSLDLAEEVATNIGAAKILGKPANSTNVNSLDAAVMIKGGLVIPDSGRGDIIRMTFSHPDSDMVVPILAKIIEVYQFKHTAIHHPENNEFVTEKIDQIKNQRDSVDRRLRDMKTGVGVMSIDDSKKMCSELLSQIQGKIYEDEAEQAGYQESIQELTAALPPTPAVTVSTNVPHATNQPAPIPEETLANYKSLNAQLASQKAKETDLLGTYTTNYPAVLLQQAQIAKTGARKTALEKSFPGLLAVKPAETKETFVNAAPAKDPREILNEEKAKSNQLLRQIQFWTNRLAQIQSLRTNIIALEGPMTQLQNEKTLLENKLSYYQQRLDENQVNLAVGPGNSDFSVVESPTPPTRDMTKVNKVTYGVLFGGLAFALGLPFLIELYLDRSLKRPMDVQIRLGLPFFISIPQVNGNGKLPSIKNEKKRTLLLDKTEEAGHPANGETIAPTNGHLALWDSRHALQPFYETLRDRLMTYFEMINLTHKPKLVAVTSCREGAGVTSTASGLASSLSETGDGRVLLVNMNVRDGETQHFYKGKLTCGLDEVLDKETRENALVHGHLYVAKELHEDDRLPRVLPKRFSHLLPKMKASDFDYIIFDMPPVSHISITPRLARFMDMVLLVVESGKTDRDAAKRATDLLAESKTNIGVVLNKNRSYLPRRLHQDI